ncbi:hypothetical protein [Aquipuribacter hungaricus]|uniref:Uncharacterized protein n=1 Tax=Aquipuribacter hungaricus TaxID=545624 RepID=A0ABV7WJT7_9MICO
MSQDDDPYRTPGQPPQPWQHVPGQQPSAGQPSPGMPYAGQPYAGQPSDLERAPRPPAVVRLGQVMLAGAVVAVLQGVHAAVAADDLLAGAAADLDEAATTSGLDPASFADLAGDVFLGVVLVVTVVTAGLWLLFARLFDRGSGRVVGTVLAALNGVTLVSGLLAPTDLLEWLLSAVMAALVVAGLVLLWRPASSAWFRAAAAGRPDLTW